MFSYNSFFPDAAMFHDLFNIPTDFMKKQVIITHEEFEKVSKE
jgi:hypothetical protein